MNRNRPDNFKVVVTLLVAIPLAIGAGFQLEAAGTQPPVIGGLLRDLAREPAPYVNARVLSADTAETVTVPTFLNEPAKKVLVSYSASCPDYYVSVTGTAAAPSGDVTDGGASERNPATLVFAQGATFSLVAPATCKVTLSNYLVQ